MSMKPYVLKARAVIQNSAAHNSRRLCSVPALRSALSTQNITCIDTEIRYCDGDGVLVRNSQNVNIDAGGYDE